MTADDVIFEGATWSIPGFGPATREGGHGAPSPFLCACAVSV